jgi:hypothetical protein
MGLIGSAGFVLLGQLLKGCSLRDLILHRNRTEHMNVILQMSELLSSLSFRVLKHSHHLQSI